MGNAFLLLFPPRRKKKRTMKTTYNSSHIHLLSAGGVWTLFTFIIQLPTYFKFIHGLDYRTAGLLSGVPHVLRMVFSYILSVGTDHLLHTGKMTRTNVRKFAVFINCIVGGCLIGLAYAGCNYVMAIILITLATTLMGAQVYSLRL